MALREGLVYVLAGTMVTLAVPAPAGVLDGAPSVPPPEDGMSRPEESPGELGSTGRTQ